MRETRKQQDWRVDLTNARPYPAKVEIVVPLILPNGRRGWNEGKAVGCCQ
jgi:hypothetical protein